MARQKPWGPQGVACGLLVLALLGCLLPVEGVQWRWWWLWAGGELALLGSAGLLCAFECEAAALWRRWRRRGRR